MTDDKEFPWIPFYESFADKLLEYREDRENLLSKIFAAQGEVIRMPKFEDSGTGKRIEDICPFTVLGTFNKHMKIENRKNVANKFAELLGMTDEAPALFDGVPTVISVKFWFFAGKIRRDPDDIDKLWRVFAEAIQFADFGNNKQKFIEAYNNACRVKEAGGSKLSMGLFWIRPNSFVSLDANTRKYITEKLLLEIKDVTSNGENYLELISNMKNKFSQSTCPVKSFPELSYEAFNSKNENEEKQNSVTEQQMLACYDLVKKYLAGNKLSQVDRKNIKEILQSPTYKMNHETAGVHIGFVERSLKGKLFTGWVSKENIEVVFDKIYQEFKNDTGQIKLFLDSLKLHVEHYSRIKRPRADVEKLYDELIKKIEGSGMPIVPNRVGHEKQGKFADYTIKTIIKEKCFIDELKLKRMHDRLEEKKNLILQGPPGTGKTWLAKRLGYALMKEKAKDRIISVQFHPNMSYEDFVMGYRPNENSELERVDGIFVETIEKAIDDKDNDYVIVIEEINRGNPAQIFGELLTLLEGDKRNPEEELRLCYHNEGEKIYIPPNLYVIGTMNLADRSLAIVDFALRRRFAFEDLKPEFNEKWIEFVNEKAEINKEFLGDIKKKIDYLNDKIKEDRELGEQFCIGHSFFTPSSKPNNSPAKWYREIVRTEIVPLLKEYWLDAPVESSESDDNKEDKKPKTKVEEAKEKLLEGMPDE